MNSSESTHRKLADATLIERSDLKIKVFGQAKREGDPMFDEAQLWGDSSPRISKVIFRRGFPPARLRMVPKGTNNHAGSRTVKRRRESRRRG
jgi:hypothetical protein